MSFQITTAFVNQYTANVQMLAQQRKTRLRGRVREEQITGEQLYIDQIGQSEAVEKPARNADSPVMSTGWTRRRIAPATIWWGELVDRQDKVRVLNDPTSEYAMAGAAAMCRKQDRIMIAAAFATAYVGHAGGTAITWPNANTDITPSAAAGTQVAVNAWNYGNGSGNAGLTVSKLIEARTALEGSEGDEEEELYFCCSAKQLGNLLATTEVTSDDYNEVKALVQGKVDKFMGFNFIRSQQLLTDSSGYRRNMAWRPSALGFGIAREIDGRITERSDKGFSTYVFNDMDLGASRLQESQLVEVLCLES